MLEDGHSLQDYELKKNSVNTLHLEVVKENINLRVQLSKGTAVSLEVSVFDTVKKIKQAIQRKTGTPTKHQQLWNHEQRLGDDCTLFDYKVTKQVELHLMTPDQRYFFRVDMHGRRVFPLEEKWFNTFWHLKVQLQRETGMPPQEQRLIFAGQLLDDGTRIADSGL